MTAAIPGQASTASGLSATDLSVTYANGARGVDGASVNARPHLITAILGRNGAGKTSLLRGIAGFLRSEHVRVGGSVVLNGRAVSGATPVVTNGLGLVFVPERDKVFPGLKVEEHLALVSGRGRGRGSDAGLIFDALERRRTARAGFLSGGERQMLALAMAIRQDPKVLLVDEMSLGLAPVVVKELLVRLRELTAEREISCLLVEQDAVAALRVADYVYVMDRGRIVWQGPADSTSAGELGRKYLGVAR